MHRRARAGTKNTENPPTNQPQSHPKQLPIPFYNFDFFTQGSIFSPILPILTPSCPFWAAWNQQGKQPPQTTLRAPYGAKNTPNPTPNQSQTHTKQLPTPLHNFEKSSSGGDFHPFWPFLPPSYPLREPKIDPKIDQKTRFSQIWVDYGQNRPGKSPTHIEASFSQLFSTIGTQK